MTFLFFNGFAQNPKRLMIEDLSSTFCGHCPCMDTLFEKVILPQHPGTIIIVYHGSNSAYYNPDLKIVCDHLAFEGAPCAIPDRRCHSQDILSLKDSVSKFYAEQPEAKIRLEMLSRS